MCKHVAAVLYGVGARLDQQPELLFRLRQVDHLELIAEAVVSTPVHRAAARGKKPSPAVILLTYSGSNWPILVRRKRSFQVQTSPRKQRAVNRRGWRQNAPPKELIGAKTVSRTVGPSS